MLRWSGAAAASAGFTGQFDLMTMKQGTSAITQVQKLSQVNEVSGLLRRTDGASILINVSSSSAETYELKNHYVLSLETNA